MNKHSPGPWSVVEGAGGRFLMDVDGFFVADCGDLRFAAGNARLIASAPELLEALKKLVYQVHDDCLREGEEVAVNEANALIARIEGNQTSAPE